MAKTLHIVGYDSSVTELFMFRGWRIKNINDTDPDVLKDVKYAFFTGGADIDPSRYNEPNKGSYVSRHSLMRDEFEFSIYKDLPDGCVKFGICRGAQLLNIVNGGSMIQHIDGHGYGHHLCETDEGAYRLNSCHHQQMVLTKDMQLLAWHKDVPEAFYHESSKSLGIQGHPEWDSGTADYFFHLIERFDL
jgi:putative glutamine amidotransferase